MLLRRSNFKQIARYLRIIAGYSSIHHKRKTENLKT